MIRNLFLIFFNVLSLLLLSSCNTSVNFTELNSSSNSSSVASSSVVSSSVASSSASLGVIDLFFNNTTYNVNNDVTWDQTRVVVKGWLVINVNGRFVLTESSTINCFNNNLTYYSNQNYYLYFNNSGEKTEDKEGGCGKTLYGSGGGGGGGSNFNKGSNGKSSSDGGLGGLSGNIVSIINNEFQKSHGGNGGHGFPNSFNYGLAGIGGGCICIIAKEIIIQGKISVEGSNGNNAGYDDGGGGAGAAGEMMFYSPKITLKGNYCLSLFGGLGGKGSQYESWTGGDGGFGANTYLKLRFSTMKIEDTTYTPEDQTKINEFVINNIKNKIKLWNPSYSSSPEGIYSGQIICSNY